MRLDILDREIRDSLRIWDHLGLKKTPAESVSWGKPKPERGIGFMHQLFAPISQKVLDEINDFNPLLKKFTYPNLLTQMNGMKTFYDAFYLYGVHHQQQSSLDMPFNLLRANIELWGVLSGPDQLLIGGGNLGRRSDSYVQRSDGSVFAAGAFTTDSEGVTCYEWPDLESFLRSELGRLAKTFDNDGVGIFDLTHLPHIGGQEIV